MTLQDVMKRKAMEIEKSKMESARAGKTGTSAYTPGGMSSITINNNRSTTDLDLTPTFSRFLPIPDLELCCAQAVCPEVL